MDRKSLINYLVLKIKNKKALIEKPLRLRGIKYIEIGKNVKIRKDYRIECLDKFCNKRLFPKLKIEKDVIIRIQFYCMDCFRFSYWRKNDYCGQRNDCN